MTSTQPAVAARHPARFPARFTVEQFHRLCEAVPEQRLELIDGELLQVIAKGTRHTAAVHRLIEAIQAALAQGPPLPLQLRVESPLDLGPNTEPEPDLALVGRREDDYWTAHPTAADTLLVIEVADTSLAFDLETKALLYSGAGISHYWVVDVQQPCLHVVHGASEEAAAWLLDLRESVERLLANLPVG
ncbi:MAG: Uma2 family endonuclease [Cyanobium sp.]